MPFLLPFHGGIIRWNPMSNMNSSSQNGRKTLEETPMDNPILCYLVVPGSQNRHLCSMQYEMIDYHRTVARQGPTKSRFTMIYVTLCNYACLYQCFHVFFSRKYVNTDSPLRPPTPPLVTATGGHAPLSVACGRLRGAVTVNSSRNERRGPCDS